MEKYRRREMFHSLYAPHTQSARKELSKSVFVQTAEHEFVLFGYHSLYEVAQCADLLMAKNPLMLKNQAQKTAIKMLTGVSKEEYDAKIDEIFLERKNNSKELQSIWENYNFLLTTLDFHGLLKDEEESEFAPEAMLERGISSIKLASLAAFKKSHFKSKTQIDPEFFDPKLSHQTPLQALEAFWNYQATKSAHTLKHKRSSTLYYAKYAKGFINLHEQNFFNYSTKSPEQSIYGVSLWAELDMASPLEAYNAQISKARLKVTCAKTFLDGRSEIVGVFFFDYINCFYKDLKSQTLHPSPNAAIKASLGEEIYATLESRFYPLFGLNPNECEAMEALGEMFTFDEGDRGALLILRDFRLAAAFSQKIIPEIIKALYDLINFSSGSSFPLFSSVFDGDIILNESLFPPIKSPLCTLISAKFLDEKIQMFEERDEYRNHYHSNPFHYYSKMSFNPLRPILIY